MGDRSYNCNYRSFVGRWCWDPHPINKKNVDRFPPTALSQLDPHSGNNSKRSFQKKWFDQRRRLLFSRKEGTGFPVSPPHQKATAGVHAAGFQSCFSSSVKQYFHFSGFCGEWVFPFTLTLFSACGQLPNKASWLGYERRVPYPISARREMINATTSHFPPESSRQKKIIVKVNINWASKAQRNTQ